MLMTVIKLYCLNHYENILLCGRRRCIFLPFGCVVTCQKKFFLGTGLKLSKNMLLASGPQPPSYVSCLVLKIRLALNHIFRNRAGNQKILP